MSRIDPINQHSTVLSKQALPQLQATRFAFSDALKNAGGDNLGGRANSNIAEVIRPNSISAANMNADGGKNAANDPRIFPLPQVLQTPGTAGGHTVQSDNLIAPQSRLAMTIGPMDTLPTMPATIVGRALGELPDGTQMIAQIATREVFPPVSMANPNEFLIIGIAKLDHPGPDGKRAILGYNFTDVVLSGAKTFDQASGIAAWLMETGQIHVRDQAMAIFDPGPSVSPYQPFAASDEYILQVLNSETIVASGLGEYNFRQFDPNHLYRDIFNLKIDNSMRLWSNNGGNEPRTASGNQLVNSIAEDFGLPKSGNWLMRLAPWNQPYTGESRAIAEKIADAVKQVGGDNPTYHVMPVYQFNNEPMLDMDYSDVDIRVHGLIRVEAPGTESGYNLIDVEGIRYESDFHYIYLNKLEKGKVILVPEFGQVSLDKDGRYEFLIHRR